jgi:hypothetical protein
MALVLAIESDARQAGILRRIVRAQVPADLVVWDSKDLAIASIAERMPDLILVSALMSPREETELTEHLRSLQDADHLQTLTIPLLASTPAAHPAGSKMLRALGWRHAQALEGCDPSMFADEIRGYLERACELRAQRMLERNVDEGMREARTDQMAATDAGVAPVVTEQPLIVPLAASVDVTEPVTERESASSIPWAAEAQGVAEQAAQVADTIDAADEDVDVVFEPVPTPAEVPYAAAIMSTEEAAPPESSNQPVAVGLPPFEPMGASLDGGEPVGQFDVSPSPVSAVEAAEAIAQTPDEIEAESDAVDSPEPLRKETCVWIADPIDALRLDARRTREERVEHPLAPAAVESGAPPHTGEVRIEEPAPAPLPTPVSPGERVLRLVKTERHHARKPKAVVSSETSPSPPKRRSPETAQPAPIKVVETEDEWGIHDPRECGFDALMARLDASTGADSAPEERRDEAPVAPASPSRASRENRSGGTRRVVPLAIWAHAQADEPETEAEPNDLRALLACLAVPAGIAAVSFPTGCRIRRIRVAPPARPTSATTPDRNTIILSRRLLRELQRRDASRAERPTRVPQRPVATLAGAGA